MRGDTEWGVEYRSARATVYVHPRTGASVEITPRYARPARGRRGVPEPVGYCVELIPEWFERLPPGLSEMVGYATTLEEAERVARRLMAAYDAQR